MEVIGLAIAVIAVAGAVTVPFLKALSAERRAGEQKARADSLDVNLTGLAAQLSDVTNQRNTEKQRAEKLDARLQKFIVAAATTGVDGLFKQLLLDAQAEDTEHGEGARELHNAAATHAPGPDDLLDPSQD